MNYLDINCISPDQLKGHWRQAGHDALETRTMVPVASAARIGKGIMEASRERQPAKPRRMGLARGRRQVPVNQRPPGGFDRYPPVPDSGMIRS